jgi:hypothetical protein
VGLRSIVATAMLLLPAARPLPAQTPAIAPGVWRGYLMWSENDSLPVRFLVQVKGKDIWITMRSRNNPDYGMGDIKLKNEVLTFSWALGAGTFLQCRLSRRGGPSFDGLCKDSPLGSQGKPINVLISMRPPSDST